MKPQEAAEWVSVRLQTWFPFDLVAAVGWTLAVGATLVSARAAAIPVRPLLAVVFVLFVPGYVLVSALFPRGQRARRGQEENATRVLTASERIVLSFATSLAVVILVGFALGVGGRLDAVSLYVSLAAITGLGTVGGLRRRRTVDPQERIDLGTTVSRVYRQLFAATTRGELVVNTLVVGTVLVAIVGVGVGVSLPAEGDDEGFTEFYLVPGETDGSLDPSDYADAIVFENETGVTAVIHNREDGRETYTVVALLQETAGPGNHTVVREAQLYSERVTLGADESTRLSHRIEPVFSGGELRLAYLLYADDAVEEPSVSTAYRELHLWVDVPERTTEPASVRTTGFDRSAGTVDDRPDMAGGDER